MHLYGRQWRLSRALGWHTDAPLLWASPSLMPATASPKAHQAVVAHPRPTPGPAPPANAGALHPQAPTPLSMRMGA